MKSLTRTRNEWLRSKWNRLRSSNRLVPPVMVFASVILRVRRYTGARLINSGGPVITVVRNHALITLAALLPA